MTVWQGVTEGLGHGGYVAWESAIAAATGQAGQDHLPDFAALQPAGEMMLAEVIDASLALPGVHYSRHERDLLVTERALAGGGWPHEVRLVAFCPWSTRSGAILRRQKHGRTNLDHQEDLDPRMPAAAVIDDGIGLLNAASAVTRGTAGFARSCCRRPTPFRRAGWSAGRS